MVITDLNGYPHPVSKGLVIILLVVSWLCHISACILTLIFYLAHPAQLNKSPVGKGHVWVFGTKRYFPWPVCYKGNAGTLASNSSLIFIKPLRVEMRWLLALPVLLMLLALLAFLLLLLVTLKQVEPTKDVVSHPFAAPVVSLIESEFLRLQSFQLLMKRRKEARRMLAVVVGTGLDLASAPKVTSSN